MRDFLLVGQSNGERSVEVEIVATSAKRWRLLAIILILVCLSLLIAIIVVASKDSTEPIATCGENYHDAINTAEPQNPGIFDDLTVAEIKNIQNYLASQSSLNMDLKNNVDHRKSQLHLLELSLPNKSEALDYLDSSGRRPQRQAKLLLLRPDLTPPVCEEYLIGPLPNPLYHRLINYSNRRNPVEFAYRPLSGSEMFHIMTKMYAEIDENIGDVLLKIFGANFTDCGVRCLTFTPGFVHSSMHRTPDRFMWLIVSREIEYYFLHPIDLGFLLNIASPDPSERYVDKIWMNGKLYKNFNEVRVHFNANFNLTADPEPFPENNKYLFSTLHMRGDPKPELPKAGPRQTEPDGKRYTIDGRYIEYLGWSFNFRVAIQTGPQLLNVKYNNERIAYEISLQEMSVFYSGDSPLRRHSDHLDGVWPIGTSLLTLVPGVDCPEHATFLSVTYLVESTKITTTPSAVCIFEHNNGIPLRRHSAFLTPRPRTFYAGMPDNILIVRSALVVGNDDYFNDFIFHQGGGVEVRFTPTGYLSTNVHTDGSKYGFKLRDNIAGNIHYHAVNYKVDLDVKGTSNRFETLDIEVEELPNYVFPGKHRQIKYKRNLKKAEQDAAYKYHFETPKFLIFHNKEKEREGGTPRAYRLSPNGVAKQLVVDDSASEGSISWARYQVAVTKHKDEELSSSSPYAQWDGYDPVVAFQRFVDDNETIVDEDLVAWVTLATHHIPHTEDMPTKTTVGGQLQFFLLPYNYFDEDASMSSRDAVRFDLEDDKDRTKGVRIERNGLSRYARCIPRNTDFDEKVKKNPALGSI